ncbi:hypothetical protein Glove_123g47 [Diversispora epigaea]|uniref:Uncharacterized protein n=1 Tax=Diversispora epigaea TaxID=1348612 RepID=A0A397J7C0_9GLOM|nr:hypothetical protein Glove_123g47 [Diversispora epigaea]
MKYRLRERRGGAKLLANKANTSSTFYSGVGEVVHARGNQLFAGPLNAFLDALTCHKILVHARRNQLFAGLPNAFLGKDTLLLSTSLRFLFSTYEIYEIKYFEKYWKYRKEMLQAKIEEKKKQQQKIRDDAGDARRRVEIMEELNNKMRDNADNA